MKILKLKNLLLASSLLISIFSSQVLAYTKILKVGAIPDQNQEVLDKRFNLFGWEFIRSVT